MSGALSLDHEIRTAFAEGWSRAVLEQPRPEGKAAITKVKQAGYDAAFTSDGFAEALRKYLDG